MRKDLLQSLLPLKYPDISFNSPVLANGFFAISTNFKNGILKFRKLKHWNSYDVKGYYTVGIGNLKMQNKF